MKKIISLFQRHYDGDRQVYDEVVPGAEWVIAGEGVATRKLDGTCCMVRDGKLYKRYELKQGRKPPAEFEPATGVDAVTGKQQGWVPVGDGPEDRWHREAFFGDEPDGTYELCGPKIQGGAEIALYPEHRLWRHGKIVLEDVPRDFDGLHRYLATANIEGIVWHHPDGRVVKIKTRDFGLAWPRVVK